jgi:hypothetical protein
MPINQIFNKKVPIKLIIDIVNIIGIKDLDDTRDFYYSNIESKIEKMNEKLNELKQFYIPCKRKIYFTEIDNKKIITILRQTLKLYDYTIISKEKYMKDQKKKNIVLSIQKKITKTVRNTDTYVLSFD